MRLKYKNIIISFLSLIVAIVTMYLTYETLYKNDKNVSNNKSGYISIGGDLNESNLEDNQLGSNNKKIRVEKSSISNNESGYISIGGSVDKSKISNNILGNNSSEEKTSVTAVSTFGVTLKGAEISVNAARSKSNVGINLTDIVDSKIENNVKVDLKIEHPKIKRFLEEVFDREKFSMILGSCDYFYSLANFLYPKKSTNYIDEIVEKFEKRRNIKITIENIDDGNIVNTYFCLNKQKYCEKIKIKMKPEGKSFYAVTDIKIISNEQCSLPSLDCSNTSESTLAYADYSSFDPSLNGVLDNPKKTTSLHTAVNNGDVLLVKKLMKKEVKVAINPYFSSLKLIKTIKPFQTNIDARDESGATALEIAVWGGFPKITTILIENKANIFVGKGDDSWSLVNDASDPMTGIKPEIANILNNAVEKVKSLTCSAKKIYLN